MRRVFVGVTAICCLAASNPEPVRLETNVELAHRFLNELECTKPEKDRAVQTRVQRQWCAVSMIDQDTFTAPTERVSLIGVSIGLPPRAPILSALHTQPELAVLTVDAHGALVTSLRPFADKERKELIQATASLSLVLKGSDKTVHVAPAIATYLKSLHREKLHPLQPSGKAATYEARMPSSLFSVKGAFGKGFVVVEQAEDGVRINLFPLAPVSTD
jgi:hypothetical protein